MSIALFGRVRERFRSLTEERRTQFVGMVFSLGLLISIAYQLSAGSQGTGAVFQVIVLIGFGALWPLIGFATQKWPTTAVSMFGTVLLTGALALGGAGLAEAIFASGAIYTHLFAVLSIGFVFVLMWRLRELVLFKRTRKSVRNWRWMLVLMVLTAVTTIGKAPGSHLGVFQAVFLVPAAIFMVINAFRLSWIVHVSFREKLICMGLAIALIVLLGVSLSGALAYAPVLRQYSYPLSLFAATALIFGILYSTATFLTLLFHLPTTSEFQRKTDEMAAMGELSRLVGQAFDRDKLHDSIAAAAVEAGSAERTWLMIPNENASPHIVAAHHIDAPRARRLVDTEALFDSVRRTHRPIRLNEAPTDPRVRVDTNKKAPTSDLSSLLVVPLIAREQLLGVLFAAKGVTHGFERDDVEAIRTLSAQAALALDHAHLFEAQVKKERIERELDIARTVQHRLLPAQAPDVPGLALTASSTSAKEVGGDYYDFHKLPDGRLAFIIADVSGKGTSAAFYMAVLQGVFQSAARLAPSPTDFLCHANEAIGRTLEKQVFISALYGVFDPDRQALTFARAGHCPAAAVNASTDAHLLRPSGLGLGLTQGPLLRTSLTEKTIPLQPGDVFVFYTDGIVESRGADGEEYGYERLLSALRTYHHEDPEALHAALLEDCRTFAKGNARDDDTTLVVCKWTGTPSVSAHSRTPPSSVPKTPALDSS